MTQLEADGEAVAVPLTEEQIEQLNVGIGCLLPPTAIYKLGYRAAHASLSRQLAEAREEIKLMTRAAQATQIAELAEELATVAAREAHNLVGSAVWSPGQVRHLAQSFRFALATLSRQLAEARAVLQELSEAEMTYRHAHDVHHDGSMDAGRAWDKLRQAGDRARRALKER